LKEVLFPVLFLLFSQKVFIILFFCVESVGIIKLNADVCELSRCNWLHLFLFSTPGLYALINRIVTEHLVHNSRN